MPSPPLFARPPYPVSPDGALSQFRIAIPDDEIQKLKTILKILPIARPNYENGHNDRKFGTPRDWLVDAVDYWQNKFDWRRQEETINNIPQFKVEVKDDDSQTYSIHFAALFSENPDAIPILFSHGWPGSIIEFMPILLMVREQYASDPKKLPYHIIVPSLIGFGFSSPPPLNKDFAVADNARLLHKMMTAIGFAERGYVVQGGDLGAPISIALASQRASVKAIHLNMFFVRPKDLSEAPPALDSMDRRSIDRGKNFWATGMAYAMTHATRPSTAGLALGSSPVALLAWIGEKMVDWADPASTLSLDTILTNVSIYWFTGTYPTSIWCYRAFLNMDEWSGDSFWDALKGKPLGFSWFPNEISGQSKAMIKADEKVTQFYEYDRGGHFAALEQPKALWSGVEDFLSKVWKN